MTPKKRWLTVITKLRPSDGHRMYRTMKSGSPANAYTECARITPGKITVRRRKYLTKVRALNFS